MFITFEGIDGCGKSTQARLLVQRLEKDGHTVHLFREPGGTDLSERVRALLLDPGLDIRPLSELLLFSAARAQLVERSIRPALDSGAVVVCDRFYDSTTAYQGAGRRVADVAWVKDFNRTVTGGLVPDRTYYLAIETELAMDRRDQRDASRDRMEQGSLEFYRRIIAAYDQLAADEPVRFRRLAGDRPVEELHESIWSDVESSLRLR